MEREGRTERALKVANKAIKVSLVRLDPARVSNLTTNQFGFDTSRLAEDILKITKALSENEKAELYAWRGFLYSSIGEYDMALKDYDKALDLDNNVKITILEVPAEKCVLYLKSIALWQAGKLREAVTILDTVISVNPNHQGAYYYRGIIKSKLGDNSGALADLEKAINIGGKFPAQQMRAELTGVQSGEVLSGTFLVSFFANQPPLSRPYGYIWMIEQ